MRPRPLVWQSTNCHAPPLDNPIFWVLWLRGDRRHLSISRGSVSCRSLPRDGTPCTRAGPDCRSDVCGDFRQATHTQLEDSGILAPRAETVAGSSAHQIQPPALSPPQRPARLYRGAGFLSKCRSRQRCKFVTDRSPTSPTAASRGGEATSGKIEIGIVCFNMKR